MGYPGYTGPRGLIGQDGLDVFDFHQVNLVYFKC
jgi:hypothetical protein